MISNTEIKKLQHYGLASCLCGYSLEELWAAGANHIMGVGTNPRVIGSITSWLSTIDRIFIFC
jgi:hypothetical protein